MNNLKQKGNSKKNKLLEKLNIKKSSSENKKQQFLKDLPTAEDINMKNAFTKALVLKNNMKYYIKDKNEKNSKSVKPMKAYIDVIEVAVRDRPRVLIDDSKEYDKFRSAVKGLVEPKLGLSASFSVMGTKKYKSFIKVFSKKMLDIVRELSENYKTAQSIIAGCIGAVNVNKVLSLFNGYMYKSITMDELNNTIQNGINAANEFKKLIDEKKIDSQIINKMQMDETIIASKKLLDSKSIKQSIEKKIAEIAANG